MTPRTSFFAAPLTLPEVAETPDVPESFFQGPVEAPLADDLGLLPLAQAEIAVFLCDLEALADEQDKLG